MNDDDDPLSPLETSEDPDAEFIQQITRAADGILAAAVEQGATHVHLDPRGSNEFQARARLPDRTLVRIDVPRVPFRTLLARFKILARLDIAARRIPQDGRVEVLISGRRFAVLCATMPIGREERMILRLRELNERPPTLADLRLPQSHRATIASALRAPGIVVVGAENEEERAQLLRALAAEAGPDSRAVFAIASTPGPKWPESTLVVTLDDPARTTIAMALFGVRRHDADVVIVDSVRELETLTGVLQAAEDMCVVASLPSVADPRAAACRLVEMGADPRTLAAPLRCFLWKRRPGWELALASDSFKRALVAGAGAETGLQSALDLLLSS